MPAAGVRSALTRCIGLIDSRKFCKDCRFIRIPEKKGWFATLMDGTNERCGHIKSRQESPTYLVTGDEKHVWYQSAVDMRKGVWECGLEGKLYEPIDS